MAMTGQDFETYQGNDETITIAVVDQNGTAYDMSGATVTWIMAPKAGATAVLTKTLTVSGSSLGLVLTHDEMEHISAGVYYHEASAALSGGLVKTVFTGLASILPAQTAIL